MMNFTKKEGGKMTNTGGVMTQEENVGIEAQAPPSPSDSIDIPKTRKKKYVFWVVIAVLLLAWILLRPGVFTIQPIGALPEGITFVYYGRGSEMPFFSSPDGLCLQMQGKVSLFCRAGALSAATELKDRIILRMPYSRWAYLRSTGGLEFDR
jgi:hypothetical protein